MTTSRTRLLGLLALASTSAQAINIADVPLFVSTEAQANVVLLIDNSGSMRNLITDSGYSATTTYPDWSLSCGDLGNTSCWKAANNSLSSLPKCAGTSNSDDIIRGVRGGVQRCVRLPDPYGSNRSRVSGNYMNYLIETYGQDGLTVDLRPLIPNSYRMQVAQRVASNIVRANSNLRIGIASFNRPISGDGGPGGRINATCGSSTTTLLNSIAALTPSTNTPLAETYYEITRYYRGMSSEYNTGVSYTSPITLRCQKSFVVAVTDGFPTQDIDIPPDLIGTLPNYDGLDPVTLQSDYPVFPQYSDGFRNHDGGSQGNEGYSLYLDDLALFGYETDMRPSGTDAAGGDFNDPEFAKQNLVTYTVGFAQSNQMLQDAADRGDGAFYIADNEAQLNEALQSAFRNIQSRLSSAASVTSSSGYLSNDTLVYQARFNASNWSGGLIARKLDLAGNVSTPIWDAADEIPLPNARRIYTSLPTAIPKGQLFLWDSLDLTQQGLLNIAANGVVDTLGPDRLNYLRGDRSNELPNGLQLRPRAKLLGDIVNSDPYFVGNEDYGFGALPGGEGTSYTAFRSSDRYKNRTRALYVGANDGMLHAFNADSGVELFAYVPHALLAKLPLLTSPAYDANHKFFVDGSPRVLDAQINGTWESVLIGGLGAGGRGVFALRVTDPGNFGVNDVLWEFNATLDPDMGYSLPQPTIARLNDGSWAAIVANGYNSASGKAVLFILDLDTGAVLKKIDTFVGGDNGLSTPIPVDADGDQITDYVYAGDLKGNMWKFDLSGSTPLSWGSAFNNVVTFVPEPLFTACADFGATCAAGTRQVITARPEVALQPGGGSVVFFGTGRYLASGDTRLTSPINSFYGIYDNSEKGLASLPPVGSGRGNLLEQAILTTQAAFDEYVRTSTNHQPASTHKGWYMDLPESGERQISRPILRGGKVIFTTMTPNQDACGFGGTSWLMEIDALTGSRLDKTPFDLNKDKLFNSADFVDIHDTEDVSDDIPVSGRQSKQGFIKTPGIVVGDGIEYKYGGGSTGELDITVENVDGAFGRQSWRYVE